MFAWLARLFGPNCKVCRGPLHRIYHRIETLEHLVLSLHTFECKRCQVLSFKRQYNLSGPF